MQQHLGSFILQGNLASNDEEQEDQVSQGTARSYSSVAPLGLPAGDQGIDFTPFPVTLLACDGNVWSTSCHLASAVQIIVHMCCDNPIARSQG